MGFKELERRSLVTVGSTDEPGRLQTHGVVRSIGVGILRDPEYATPLGTRYYGSRLWSSGGIEFLEWSKVRCVLTIQLGNCLFGLPSRSLIDSRAFVAHPQEQSAPLVAVALADPINTQLALDGMDLRHLRLLRVSGDQVGCGG